MTDFDRLLAAIRENPGEDAPRLVYADWLEENAGTVACAACDGTRLVQHRPPRGTTSHAMGHIEDCPICHGTGRVSDGLAELAAFIRVQVELAARDDERCRCRECQPTGQHTNEPCRSSLKPLRRRVRELWPAVQGHFLPRDGLKWLPMLDGRDSQLLIDARTQMPLVLIRRGLPAVVRCTLAEWMGGECGQCQGRGQRTIYGDGSGPWTKCQYCVDGLTPGIGPRLAQRWPIEAVEVTDRRSYLRPEPRDDEWLWFAEDADTDEELRSYSVPAAIYELMIESHPQNDDGSLYLSYDSEPAARTALSDALIAWARGQHDDR